MTAQNDREASLEEQRLDSHRKVIDAAIDISGYSQKISNQLAGNPNEQNYREAVDQINLIDQRFQYLKSNMAKIPETDYRLPPTDAGWELIGKLLTIIVVLVVVLFLLGWYEIDITLNCRRWWPFVQQACNLF